MTVDPIKIIVLVIIPFTFSLFAYYLHDKGKEPWFIRKYLHTVGLTLIAIYAMLFSSIEEIIITVSVVILIIIILSIIPLKFAQTMIEFSTRKGEKQIESLINSSLTTIVALILMIVLYDYKWIFTSSLLTVAFGDALGEFIGKPYGRHKYRIIAPKSIEGSIAVFAGALIGIMIPYLFYGFVWSSVPVIIIAALVAMIIEALSISFLDNILMPSVTAFILYNYLL